MMIEYRNARYNQHGTIDVDLYHPVLKKWVEFTASPDDPEEYGRKIYEQEKDRARPYKEVP